MPDDLFGRPRKATKRKTQTSRPAQSTTTRPAESAISDPAQGGLELIHYKADKISTDFTFDRVTETIWATQQQMAKAFGISPNTVGEHLGNVFR